MGHEVPIKLLILFSGLLRLLLAQDFEKPDRLLRVRKQIRPTRKPNSCVVNPTLERYPWPPRQNASTAILPIVKIVGPGTYLFIYLSRPDISMIAAGMTLHKCLVSHQLNFRIESFSPGVITPTNVCVSDFISVVFSVIHGLKTF